MHCMHCFTAASVLIIPYLIDLTLAAPSFTDGQSSISQLLKPNTTLNATSTNPVPNPSYEIYEIPETDLILHLSLLQTVDRLAMQSCLQTAFIWVGYQRQSDIMPKLDFEWKDPAGAVFYIRSLSRHLTWADLKNVLRGLREDLEDEQRYFTTSFTVEQKSTQFSLLKGGSPDTSIRSQLYSQWQIKRRRDLATLDFISCSTSIGLAVGSNYRSVPHCKDGEVDFLVNVARAL